MTGPELRRDVVIVALGISAGIHAALAPGHFAEGIAQGAGFVAAAALLAATAVGITVRPGSVRAIAAAAAAFSGLLVSYALATTTGLPVVHPEPEPLDGLALATKAVELVGLTAATTLIHRPRAAVHLPQPERT